MKITIINGTIRNGNRTQDVVSEARKYYEEKYGFEVKVITLIRYSLNIGKQYHTGMDREDLELIKWCDTLIFITPIYNSNIPPCLLDFINKLTKKDLEIINGKNVKLVVNLNKRNDTFGGVVFENTFRNAYAYAGINNTNFNTRVIQVVLENKDYISQDFKRYLDEIIQQRTVPN